MPIMIKSVLPEGTVVTVYLMVTLAINTLKEYIQGLSFRVLS